jgi:hypothetical protein
VTGIDGAVAIVTRIISIVTINDLATVTFSRGSTTFMETGGAVLVDDLAVRRFIIVVLYSNSVVF